MAYMGEGRDVYRVLVGKPEGKSHRGDPDVDGKIILRRTSGSGRGLWGMDRVGSG